MKLVYSVLSPGGMRGRLSTLIFHRVLREPDPLFPGEMHAARFNELCGWLRQWFEVLPLDEAVRRLQQRSLPPRALAITFDDGYADNAEVALPILQRHGLPASFFIATGFLDGGCMWNDQVIEAVRECRHDRVALDALGGEPAALATAEQRRGLIERVLTRIKHLPPAQRQLAVQRVASQCGVVVRGRPMMRSEQVRQLHRGGMQVGAHTVTHPILAVLPPGEARAEIADSKATLEALLDAPVSLFAYPNGRPGQDYSDESVALARDCGFDAAVSTAWGVSTAETDRFQLRRFTPWDRSRWRFAARMGQNLRMQ